MADLLSELRIIDYIYTDIVWGPLAVGVDMVTLTLNTDDWPDWLEEALRNRASMHGVTFEAFVAEVLTAFVEKREPEFKKDKECKQ